MQAIVRDLKSNNQYQTSLPIDVDDLNHLFTETFGSCEATSEADFIVLLVDTGYYEEELEVDLAEANSLANRLVAAESEYGEDALKAFFEYYSFEDLNLIEDISFYTSKYDYMEHLYELYGLTETTFLWTTVDMFLDDDDIFERIAMGGDVYEASNGVIVDCC